MNSTQQGKKKLKYCNNKIYWLDSLHDCNMFLTKYLSNHLIQHYDILVVLSKIKLYLSSMQWFMHSRQDKSLMMVKKFITIFGVQNIHIHGLCSNLQSLYRYICMNFWKGNLGFSILQYIITLLFLLCNCVLLMVPSIYVENCNSTTVFLINIISRCVVIITTYGDEIFLVILCILCLEMFSFQFQRMQKYISI